jgi:hypothetical protein
MYGQKMVPAPSWWALVGWWGRKRRKYRKYTFQVGFLSIVRRLKESLQWHLGVIFFIRCRGEDVMYEVKQGEAGWKSRVQNWRGGKEGATMYNVSWLRE